MKKSYTFTVFVNIFTIIAFLVLSVSITNSQTVRRVLLEEYTGTWCGPCGQYGKPLMAQILAAHPDDVYGVEVHQTDDFSIPECDTLAAYLGCSFVPAASADRTYNLANSGAVLVGTGSWNAIVNAALQVQPKCSVKLYYTLNKTTRTLTAKISATFDVSVAGDLRFNVIITEDDLIHSQNGASQTYHHMHVLRDMLGYTWGTPGIIPANVSSGQSFNYTYQYSIPPSWNLDNLHFIGVVQEFNQQYADMKKILNCIEGVEGQPQMEFTKADGPDVFATPKSQPATKDYTIKNLTNSQMTYQITIAKSSRTPSDWNVELQLPSGAKKSTHDNVLTDEITINAGGNKTVTLKLTPGSLLGVGDAAINVIQKNNPTGDQGNASITVASSEIDKFQVIDDAQNGTFSIGPTMVGAGVQGYYDINASEFTPIYNQFDKINDVVWTCGTEGEISNDDASAIRSLINDGVPVLISGSKVVGTIEAASPNLFYTIGCSFGGVCKQGTLNGSDLTINLIGYKDDPITDGFDKSVTVSNYFTQGILINNPKTYPILKHKYVDTVVAVRSELANARVVLIGINPMYITNTSARYNLIGNAIKWLNNTGPKISSSETTIDFGNVVNGTNSDKPVVIRNIGEDPLTITDMSVEYDYSNIFSVQNPSIPFTIQPGDSQQVTLRFSPNYAFTYDVPLTVTSNAINNGTFVITLKGTGIEAGSGPSIESDLSTVVFGNVPTNKPKDANIVITNSGKQNLIINSANIVSDNSGIFTIISPASFPVTIAPSQNKTTTIRFSPSDKIDYTGTLNIASNAENSDTLSIPLSGTGDNPVGVEDNDCNCPVNLAAAPNPFNSRTTISYNVGSNGAYVSITVIDERGTQVASLVNKTLAAGSYTQEFNSKGLSSGMYIIIANINGITTQLPVVIEK